MQAAKEKSNARERALEFAKSIPKPKIRPNESKAGGDLTDINRSLLMENGVIEEEPFDEYGNTLKGSELNDLNYRHDMLASEVDKMKKLFN
jgi:hypothetical protein